MDEKNLVIIGAGPNCVYSLDRLASHLKEYPIDFKLSIYIFERCGQFGAGQVHSAEQPKSSFLNRIAGQVSFAADSTVVNAGPLLNQSERLLLNEWCQVENRNRVLEELNLTPEDWPKRCVHGMALNHYFKKYCKIINDSKNTSLITLQAEVVDIKEVNSKLFVYSNSKNHSEIEADFILFATGHSSNNPENFPDTKEYYDFAESSKNCDYIPSAYPLENSNLQNKITPNKVVGCGGMGLTAIDTILFLTEGQGGIFKRNKDGILEYFPSGNEPKSIIPFSESGLFTFARPYNAKEKDLEKYEYKGTFMTFEAIDKLRDSVGIPVDIEYIGTRQQIDFEKHVWPLMLLEMEFLYYKTFFGDSFVDFVLPNIMPLYKEFLSGSFEKLSSAEISDKLTSSLRKDFKDVSEKLDLILSNRGSQYYKFEDFELAWNVKSILSCYLNTIYGEEIGQDILKTIENEKADFDIQRYPLPFGYSLLASDKKFNWNKQISPISTNSYSSPDDYREQIIEFMRKDRVRAKQNNLNNPDKSVSDGIWRDLRPVLSYAADFGGLNAESHRVFLTKYMRYHNRLANGAALEVMEKIESLIQSKIVNPSVGPDAYISLNRDTEKFIINGKKTCAKYEIDILVDGKVHPFDVENDIRPLYPNLLKRGFVKKWVNPSKNENNFMPGGLALSKEFHPIRPNGYIDKRMTFLGAPSEGIMFFQLGALRPNKNHHIMQDVLCWFNDFWDQINHKCSKEVSNVCDEVE